MGSLSIWHWMIVLLVVVLIFGTKKLRNIGQDLGGAVGIQGRDEVSRGRAAAAGSGPVAADRRSDDRGRGQEGEDVVSLLALTPRATSAPCPGAAREGFDV